MVVHGWFFQEFSDSCDLWSWRRHRAVGNGNPEALKVVRGWRIWCDLLTTSMGGGGSGVGKARGRSRPTCHNDMCLVVHGRLGLRPKKPWCRWCFLDSGKDGGWRWPFVSVYAGFSLQSFIGSYLCTVSLVVFLRNFYNLYW
jgi:hypothetical protein